MTIEQDPVEHGPGSAAEEPSTQVVRATSRTVRPTASTPTVPAGVPTPAANVTTAELPIVRPGAGVAAPPRSRYTDPRPPGRARHRDPAPVGLRALVWIFVLVFLVAVLALITVRIHPTWLSFLRNSAPTVATGSKTAPTTTTTAPTTMTLESSSGSTATYQVPAKTFTVLVTVPDRCYIQVNSPTDDPQLVFAHTVTSAANPTPITITSGSAKITFAASVSKIVVQSGTTVLGQVTSPSDAITYIFNSTKG